jgi:glutaredoxin
MIVIYGAEWCGYCKKAKALAEQYQLDFEYKDVDTGDTKQQLKALLPSAKTIPQIWWHERHIGGYDDFAREIENTLGNYGQGHC